MIEANEEKRTTLEEAKMELGASLYMCLLGAEQGLEKVFYVMESGSSVFEEDSPLPRRRQSLKMRTLDSLFDKGNVDFLKLDVQGYELEVLKGAETLLRTCQAVLLEVSLIEINKGAPLFCEVISFMAARGFEVCDFLGIHRRPLDEATNQIDVLFVRRDSQLLTDTRHFS
jgi:FkbM family methyltransferase